MTKKVGSQSIRFQNKVHIIATAATVGPKEGEGPLSHTFDRVLTDILDGEETWEKAESKMVKENLNLVLSKTQLTAKDIDYVISGDLLNQSTGSTFGLRDFEIPFFGIFGACSTFGEALSIGSILIDGDFATNVLSGASSHFCAAEKQFRYPLDLGTQRALTTTWTVTGDGFAVLSKNGDGPCVTEITPGKIVDMGITDSNNMGAAMAASAVDTLTTHFKDFGRTPDYYDVIATGDLGYVGQEIVMKLMQDEGYDLSHNYTDCGIEIFDRAVQDTHSGGSGCGCCAVTFSGHFYKMLRDGKIQRILLIPTGALMNSTSIQQGESIPGIAHAVVIENI